MSRPRVVLLRGHSANPWELGTWAHLLDRFEVVVAVTGSNAHDVSGLPLPRVRVAALRDRLPGGRLGALGALALGDRYLGLDDALAGADIVHSAELGVWWSGQPAALRARHGFRLVLTCWETIPFRETYRRFRGRADRLKAIASADLFLAATERARRCLELEGVDPDRVVVVPPGIDIERFAVERQPQSPPLIVSPGRLVWEKGHFDVLRAARVMSSKPRVLLVGSGPEHRRLAAYADDLGLAGRADIRSVPYEGMPAVYGQASWVVLASLPIPHWEEQFGMVLAEAMAAGVPIAASTSGAIPEVLAGSGASLFAPGDWSELARLLDALPVDAGYPPELVRRYSQAAAADRLADAYERVLATAS